MQKFGEFQVPSAQEQEAKVAQWKGKLVDRYLKDERDPRLKPQPSADSKSQEAANDKTETATQQPPDSAEPWLYEENGRRMVQASLIPGSVRSIWPGTPVTRDLRFDRMNIMCDKNGLITNVSFG